MTPPCPETLRAAALPVRHGFFTRRGGHSTGPFASLNCSLSGRDDPGIVLRNRAAAAQAIGADPNRLLGLMQVHGTDCITVTEPWATGSGPRADAMVTACPGMALGIVTADCAPVLFADAAQTIVGAAHAGWRGAVAGILESTITAMRALGATDIAAAIGPCIGPASYEVGQDLFDAVLSASPADERFFTAGRRQGHWQFDLPAYCANRLAQAGVRHIETIASDTCAEEVKFFSHRRRTLSDGGPIGHQISIIVAERCPS